MTVTDISNKYGGVGRGQDDAADGGSAALALRNYPAQELSRDMATSRYRI
jgi:hypothetical protein